MKASQVKERMVKLEKHAAGLLDIFIHLKERYAMLEPMLFQADVVNRLGTGTRTRGYLILRHSLFLSCCQDIAKIVMDDYDKTPSIKRLMAALEHPAVVAELRRRYAVVHPAIVYPEPGPGLFEIMRRRDEEEARMLAGEFDRRHSDLIQAWRTLACSSVIKGFIEIRNKASAHAELVYRDGAYSFFDVSMAGITWGDLRCTLASIQHTIGLLGAVFRGAGFAWERLDEQLASAASEFWHWADPAVGEGH